MNDKYEDINNKLKSISNYIIEAYNNGIPYEAISEMLNNTKNLIKNCEKNKILIKK